jgi:hypothetical protein
MSSIHQTMINHPQIFHTKSESYETIGNGRGSCYDLNQ